MKRRTFINSLVGYSAATALSITYERELISNSPEYIAKRKSSALFQRFFKTATSLAANENQLTWFDQYQSGTVHKFTGARQTGMTEFLLVLALYEKKVVGNNVALITQQAHQYCLTKQRVADMEHRLGKSAQDGQIFWAGDLEKFDKSIRGHKVKCFVMNDGSVLHSNTQPAIRLSGAPKEEIYYFGTRASHIMGKSHFAKIS